MNNFLLKILDLFQSLYRLIGVDYTQLRAIVNIKLIMDNRRQLVSYKRKENAEPSNNFVWTVFFYSLFGIFIAFALFAIKSFMVSMTMFFSYIMVTVAMTLITDFSAILLDTSDNTIILPRPVNGRTLFMARVTHILLYLGQLAIGLSAAPALVVLIKYGAVALLIFIVTTILSVVTALVFTNALYLLIMQFASAEKLKNVINYFQIVVAVFIMGGYQLLPRFLGRFDLDDYVFEIQWWSFITPPIWMAATLQAWHYKIFDFPHITLAGLALVVPIAGYYLVNRYLTPVFNHKLGALSGGIEPSPSTTQKKQKANFITKISQWVTTNSLERGAFELVFNIIGRDRKIKLKVYPVYGYIIVFGLIFMLQGRHEDFATTWQNLPTTKYHLMLLYLTFMILQVALNEIPYSDDFKASWIYYAAPLQRPGDILTGTLKAIFVRLFVPGFIAISIFVLAVWGITAIDDIIFGFFNNLIMLVAWCLLNKRSLPFSMPPNARNQSGTFIRSMMTTILIGALGLTHYALTNWPLILMGTIPLQIITIYVMLNQYKKTTWEKLTL
jgi:ABC-2 type transport system permease protein